VRRRAFLGAVAVGGVLVTASHAPAAAVHPRAARHATPAGDRVTALVIAYARAQLGKPYLWGGTGPDAFDCSGLAMRAWASAGVAIARTSQEQWASGRHVSSPKPWDLVCFAGSDGTRAAPGHVGIVTDPATRTMIEAYAAGYPVRYSHYGPVGDQGPVGFTDPRRGPR
jgi:peptidoglycan DL-endopeptidase CwlO